MRRSNDANGRAARTDVGTVMKRCLTAMENSAAIGHLEDALESIEAAQRYRIDIIPTELPAGAEDVWRFFGIIDDSSFDKLVRLRS